MSITFSTSIRRLHVADALLHLQHAIDAVEIDPSLIPVRPPVHLHRQQLAQQRRGSPAGSMRLTLAMISAASSGCAFMNCTARRRARMMARILSPCVSVAVTVATHSTLLSAGSTSSAVAIGPQFRARADPDQIGHRRDIDQPQVERRDALAEAAGLHRLDIRHAELRCRHQARLVRPWLVDFGLV